MAAQDGSKKYHVTVSGPNVNIDTMTDEAVARVVMHVIMSGVTEPPVGVTPAGQQRKPTSLTSLKDYVASSGAKGVAQQILAIAEFVCATENKDEFTREEIGEKFALAGLAPPDDLARSFQLAADYGWIGQDARALGHYFITKRGHETLSAKFAPGA
jgi:hypothetical protein